MNSFINFSGGAKGSDQFWESYSSKYGVKQIIYTCDDYDKLTFEEKENIEESYLNVIKVLKRSILDKNSYAGKLVRRDMMQANSSDALFAIGFILNSNEKDSKGYKNNSGKQLVSGGTAYAIERGIQLNKKVYVFDQKILKWHIWNGVNFEELENTPVLTCKFAGIGTRELTLDGENAIKEILSKTFPKKNLKTNLLIEKIREKNLMLKKNQ